VPRFVTFIVVGVFVLILAAFMCTYTVRFTETAVLTTFGKAGQNAIKSEPGLYFKVPYPIQNYVKYDTRVRYLQARSETQQTADNRQIIIESFCTWRVSDPLKFFQRFSNAGDRALDHYRKAEEIIRGNLRSALGATSRFRMDELFNPDAKAGRLGELEQAVQGVLTTKDPSGVSISDYGIAVVDVGVSRILLPEATTQAVNERMAANRDRLAQELTSQGESVASAIRSKADADAQRITAFAERRAQEIRTRGDLEAAEFLKQMDTNPELAVYLNNINFMRDALAKRTTLVLPTSFPGMGLFKPDALDGLKPGQIPRVNAPESWKNSPAANAGQGGGR
jgi:membrane protease subunit HflC